MRRRTEKFQRAQQYQGLMGSLDNAGETSNIIPRVEFKAVKFHKYKHTYHSTKQNDNYSGCNH